MNNASEQSLLIKLLEKLRQSGFVRDIFSVSSGSALSQFIVIAASPILMRIYSPAELGIQAVCVSLLFCAVINTLRYNQGIPLPSRTTESIEIAIIALLVLVVTTLIAVSLLFFFIEEIATFSQTPTIIDLTLLLAAIFFLIGTTEILQGVAIRVKNFKSIGLAQAAQTLFQLSYQITMGLIEPTAKHLVMGMLVGQLVATLVYAYGFYRSVSQFEFKNCARLWEVARKYKNFPLLTSPSQLINGASIQATPFLLAAFYSSDVVGLLALAQRVIGLPLTTIGYGVAQVFFQRSALTQREDPDELVRLYTRTAKTLLLISIAPIAIIAVTSPYLFSIIFGERWSDAGLYAAILAPMFVSQFTVAPLSQVMAVISAQRAQLVWDVNRLIAVSAVVIVAGQMQLDPRYCIAFYGVTMTFFYIWLYSLTKRQITLKNSGL